MNFDNTHNLNIFKSKDRKYLNFPMKEGTNGCCLLADLNLTSLEN